MQVTACAVGQASAALFATFALDHNCDEIAPMYRAMEQWLTEDTPSDFLPRLDLIEAARAYPARHAAILLPWRAALDALA